MRKLLILLALLIQSVCADAFYYNDLYFYPYMDGTARCTLRGYAPSFNGSGGVLDIPEYATDTITGSVYEVTAIADHAFQGNANIEHVFAGPKVESIGAAAFADCINLSAAVFYPSLKTIGNGAFTRCISLMALNTSAELIDTDAFRGCTALAVANLGAGVKIIGPGAFMGCTLLPYIDIPFTVEQLGSRPGYIYHQGVFEDCINLRGVTFVYNISDRVTRLKTIGNNTFKNCINIERLDLPQTVTNIYPDAFTNCAGLKHIEWGGKENLRVDTQDFTGVPVKKIDFHGNVGVAGHSLAKLTNLDEVLFDMYATEVSEALFQNSPSLRKANLESVEHICPQAFQNCANLEEVIMPLAGTIDYNAFSNCTSLKQVEFSPALTTLTACLNGSGIRELNIPDHITSMVTPSNCEELTTVTFGNGITSIPDFYACPKISDVTISENAQSVKLSMSTLRTLTVKAPTPPSASYFHRDVLANCVLTVPQGSLQEYAATYPWKDFANIREAEFSGLAAGGDITEPEFTATVSGRSLTIQSAAAATVSNLLGITVATARPGITTLTLTPGCYIVRSRGETVKVLID